MTKLSLLAGQINIPAMTTADQRDAHVRSVTAKLHQQLTAKPHDLVVLPELSTVDYSRAAFAELSVLAEDLNGPSVKAFGALAKQHNTTIVFGMPRKAEDHYKISQVAVGPDGAVIGCYDKLHICQYGASMEKEYFEKGDHLFSFSVKGIKVAPIICYDIRIPELSRTLALQHGVDLILHSGAYAQDESFFSWHDFVVTRALESQIFFLSLNRAGENFGNSTFCPPWTDENTPRTIFPQTNEHFESFELDTAVIDQAREDYTFRKDLLEDYSRLKHQEPELLNQ
ncbi:MULTISPECIES: carbon-nitrogen hydrolase family protein [unclassified Pseudovibrio]|uniref:carbon-nitrogen hydrolase family protein n=1 Tax=unclassified Pseudovibrio TaxID=2627060 RepID=UPI0007AE9B78|nr:MULTISPECIES: carbon-nitrogen hydrolase family protein [unclassified Pseudovibrio]KZK95130.1 (R)-stereoselective amidase [Pseudovibrio sp. W74]KZL07788.1 (R)-stereoselective amidase [Pseudovibrio sp. Ad14]